MSFKLSLEGKVQLSLMSKRDGENHSRKREQQDEGLNQRLSQGQQKTGIMYGSKPGVPSTELEFPSVGAGTLCG